MNNRNDFAFINKNYLFILNDNIYHFRTRDENKRIASDKFINISSEIPISFITNVKQKR